LRQFGFGVALLTSPANAEGTYINEEERPNQVPPGSQERPGEVAPQPQASPGYSGSGDAEIQELQRAFPTTEWPPSMRKE
jgi:hypothetical protein